MASFASAWYTPASSAPEVNPPQDSWSQLTCPNGRASIRAAFRSVAWPAAAGTNHYPRQVDQDRRRDPRIPRRILRTNLFQFAELPLGLGGWNAGCYVARE